MTRAIIKTARRSKRVNPAHYFVVPPKVPSAQWLYENVLMPYGTETGGKPFSLELYPHVDGVLDAFDDPNIRMIILQWGTRLGKTTTCLSLMAKQAGTNPRNMMFASPTKEAAGKVIGERLYPILASTKRIKHQLLAESRRSKFLVKLHACRVFVGWSGSETSLADVGAYFGVGNEIDKWDQDASNEADSLPLFLNRFEGFTNHKIILESTPTIKHRSRIEDWMDRSNRHRRYVPCPHCKHYQVLRKGEENRPGGIKWDRDEKGQSDANIAFVTAYYECERCQGKIENHHRKPILRQGVWVADGCTIDDEGKIHGKAIKQGADIVGLGPLPRWYATTETWGKFARAWIRAQRRPRDLQDVVNSYMAETWEPRKSKSTPEVLGDRIGGTTRRGIVPMGGRFLTVTIDRQAADGGFCVWTVLAHGDEDRVWEVDHGMALTLEELWNPVIRANYQHEDGGQPMTPVAWGVDSGWNTKDTYDFCAKHPGTLPLKGSSTDLGGLSHRLVVLESGQHAAEGQLLLHVGTDFWETDLQTRLDDRLKGEPGSLTLALDSASDMEFLSQLCNGTIKDSIDTRRNAKLLWQKKEENVPNDFRDCIRYGLCLGRAWLEQNEGQMPQRTQNTRPESTILYRGDTRADGRLWNE